MKKLLYPNLIACLLITSLHAQSTFVEKINGLCNYSENAYSGIQTKDGGYIATGITACQGQGSFDIPVVRLDANGDVLWTKVLGGGSQDYGIKIIATSDTTYAVAGYTKSVGAGSNDMILFSIDDQGDTLWTRLFGFSSQDYAQDMVQTSDKGFLLAGSTRDPNSGDDNMYLVRTDEEGNLIWSKSYGGTSSDYAYAVRELSDKSIVMLGYSSSFGVSQDILVVKTDSVGNVIWIKTIGDDDTDYGYDVQETTDGGMVICGKSRKPYTSGNTTWNLDNAYLIKLDKNGNEEWSKLYGESLTNDIAYKVMLTSDGYLLSGESNSYSTGEYDLMMIQTDTLGNIQWAQKYGFDNAFEYGGYVCKTNDGGLLLTGQSQKAFGLSDYDLFIIKTDMFGNVDCQSTIIYPTDANAAISITDVIATDSSVSSTVNMGITTGTYSTYEDSMYCLNASQLTAYYSYSGSNCAGGTVSFTDQSFNATAWSWNFGDSNSGSNNYSTLQNPTHIFNQSGNYTISLIVTNGNYSDSISLQINVSIASNPVDLGNDTNKCGDNAMVLNAGTGFSYYSWNTGSQDSAIYIYNIGTYFVSVTDQNGCTSSDTIEVFDCVHTIITEVNKESNVLLYPNPAKDQLTVSSAVEIQKIEIFDMYGKIVFEANTMPLAKLVIPIAYLPSGVYSTKVYTKIETLNSIFIKNLH